MRSMVISIIGRPNVGKSSVFNKLMKKAHKNIIYDSPGVTRDRHYGLARFEYVKEERVDDAILIDTGGFYPEKTSEETGNKKENINNAFFNIMKDHAKLAVEESDLVLLVCDIKEGYLPFDQGIIDYLRKNKKKFWLLVNKFDSDKQMGDEAEFYTTSVDIEDIYLISAANGKGLDDFFIRLHNEIIYFTENLKKNILDVPKLQKGVTPRENVVSKVAIIGGPNAGKSTLLNCLIGATRALVSDIPGTTVDPIEGFFDLYFGEKAKLLDNKMKWGESRDLLMKEYEEFRNNNIDFHQTMNTFYEKEEILEVAKNEDDLEANDSVDKLYEKIFEEGEKVEVEEKVEGSFWRTLHIVDTAGIRRQKSVDGFIEEQSVYRSLRSISEADIIIYMVDVKKGVSHQDRRLIDITLEKGKSLILCLNKMDLLKEELRNKRDKKEWLLDIRAKIPWLDFCDVITISTKYGNNLGLLKKCIKETIFIRNVKIGSSDLNHAVFELIDRNPVVVKKTGGQRLKVKYSSMIKSSPPTFILFTNRSRGISENYKRYLKNGLRRAFDLKNTPVHLIFRTGADLERRRQL